MRSRHEQHLELNQTIEVLKQNYSSDLQTIMLLHLSNGNSNAQQFKERVQQELGFQEVYVAEEGLTLELQKEEF
jgi:phosphoribosyl 1,2-cyclic phosphodiesterase